MKFSYLVLFLVAVVGVYAFSILSRPSFDLPEGETRLLSEIEDASDQTDNETTLDTTSTTKDDTQRKASPDTTHAMQKDDTKKQQTSNREIFVTDGVKHSIPLEEIRQGCFGRDCIPSVDDPEFISVDEANDLLPDDTIGIALAFDGVERFYPFNMLVTREIVNDVVAGVPLAVTYCPLCGTGVVYERTIDGTVRTFGVSGLLWQSNLLMYDRTATEDSFWSQVLGEAVFGPDTGTKLTIVPSNIVRYVDWAPDHPDAEILNTGRIGDPYNGDYYGTARFFEPDFDESTSPLSPTTNVFGIELDGQFKAYPEDSLPVGTTVDTFAGYRITITKDAVGAVTTTKGSENEVVPQLEGFWFSWIAAHPETELYTAQ